MKSITLTTSLACSPKIIFEAWLDSEQHGKMIGANAKIDPKVGGAFDIWDGYLTGTTTEIDSKKLRIVQAWRDNSNDWPEGYYSTLVIECAVDPANSKGMLLNLRQTGVPEEHVQSISDGWIEYYFEPMQDYFSAE